MAAKRSLNKIGKEFDKIVAEMKKLATEYVKADDGKKQQLVARLKQLTKSKKQLQSEMESAVNATDKDAELQIDEMVKLIRSNVSNIMQEYNEHIK